MSTSSAATTMWAKLSTRRCRRIFCRDTDPHDSHLTFIGRLRYANRLDLLLRERGNRSPRFFRLLWLIVKERYRARH